MNDERKLHSTDRPGEPRRMFGDGPAGSDLSIQDIEDFSSSGDPGGEASFEETPLGGEDEAFEAEVQDFVADVFAGPAANQAETPAEVPAAEDPAASEPIAPAPPAAVSAPEVRPEPKRRHAVPRPAAPLTVSLAEDEVQEFIEEIPRGANIKVVGVGGAGCNAVNRMIESGVKGVQFIAANTDCQSLRMSKADVRIQLGAKLTKGLGAGTDPEMGYRAAEEANERLLTSLEGADMVFVTAGFGKGTGTGAAPYVAAMANQMGALTVAVVCTPFEWEGTQKMENAYHGIERMRQAMDSVLVIIPNEKLPGIIDGDVGYREAFRIADDVLCQAVRSISDLITMPGEINLDFADVRTTLQGQGKAFMGVGEAEGEDRAVEAARKALTNPLLSDTNVEGARAILLNITVGPDAKFHELPRAAEFVREAVKNKNTAINWGCVEVDDMGGRFRVTVIAAGLEGAQAAAAPRRGLQNVATIDGRPLKEHEIVTPKRGALSAPAAEAAVPSFALHDELYDEPTFLRRQKSGISVPPISPKRAALFGGRDRNAPAKN